MSMTTETSNARGEWVLVPKELTLEMREAWERAPSRLVAEWAALLAAAPPAAARGDVRGLVSVVSDLRHSAVVDDYESDQIAFLNSIADRIEAALAAEGVQAGEVDQRARELLAAEYEREGWETTAKYCRVGEYSHEGSIALRAIASALSQQPEAVSQLTPAEIQSGHDRVKWAEGLIRQLPEDHDGRNSWLLNYGTGGKQPEAQGVVGELVEVGDDESGQPRLLIHTTRDAIRAANLVPFSQVEVRNG